jgi:hypothetical protein
MHFHTLTSNFIYTFHSYNVYYPFDLLLYEQEVNDSDNNGNYGGLLNYLF